MKEGMNPQLFYFCGVKLDNYGVGKTEFNEKSLLPNAYNVVSSIK